MKAMIVDIKAKGTAAIYCDNLISYLDQIEKSPEPEPTSIDIENYKANLVNWIETNKHKFNSELEMFRSVIVAGQNAIKAAFLLNGAAAVAMLAFVGHLAQFKPDKVALFGACILPFAFGVLVITISSGCTYLSQWFYATPGPRLRKVGFSLNIACMVLTVVSYALFTLGLFTTYRAFLGFP